MAKLNRGLLVGVDASRATRSRVTGTEAYSRELLAALLARPSDIRYRLYAGREPGGAIPIPPSTRVETRVIRLPYLWTHLRLRAELARRRPDVLFVPSHVIPFGCPVPAVVTIHDVGYLWHRSAYSPLAWVLLHLGTIHNARTARRIVVDSQATARDLVKHFGVAPERIRVAYLGGPEVREIEAEPAVLAKHGLTERYFLFVGTLQPRKNLDRTLRAFARLQQQDPGSAVLALAGAAGHGTPALARRVRELGLEDRVRLLGYVPAPELPSLYAGAAGLVFPSLYEGFGLPPLEAMAWGTPVITSNVSSLPEVVGDAGLLVDPYDVEGMVRALARLLTDQSLRSRLIAAGRSRAAQFTWERCAAEVERTVLEASD